MFYQLALPEMADKDVEELIAGYTTCPAHPGTTTEAGFCDICELPRSDVDDPTTYAPAPAHMPGWVQRAAESRLPVKVYSR